MKKAILLSLVLGAGMVLAAPKAKNETFEGTVTDAMCGAKHSMGMAGMSDRDCTLACVKKGSKYALVVGDNVYTLDGKTAGLEKYAGAKAKVKGTLKDKTINVSSVAGAS